MPPSHTFFLVRHGETPLSGRYCGVTNPPLTAQGLRQSQRAAKTLSRFPVDVCYSSPLRRAQQTASILQRQFNVPLITTPSLKELNFGAWEGLQFADIEERWPMLAGRWAKDPTRVRIPRGETFVSLRKRAKNFLKIARTEFSHGHVLVVAHGGSLAALALELLGLPDREFPNHMLPTGSVRMIRGNTLQMIHAPC